MFIICDDFIYPLDRDGWRSPSRQVRDRWPRWHLDDMTCLSAKFWVPPAFSQRPHPAHVFFLAGSAPLDRERIWPLQVANQESLAPSTPLYHLSHLHTATTLLPDAIVIGQTFAANWNARKYVNMYTFSTGKSLEWGSSLVAWFTWYYSTVLISYASSWESTMFRCHVREAL